MQFSKRPENVSQFQRIPRVHQRLGNYDGHRLWCVGVRLWLGSLSLSEPCLFLSEQAKKPAGSLASASDGRRSALPQHGVNSTNRHVAPIIKWWPKSTNIGKTLPPEACESPNFQTAPSLLER
jgi:hypothetical protein